MRKDELEEFVDKNRASFNEVVSVDAEAIWSSIAIQDLKTGRSVKKIVLWGVIITLSLFLAFFFNSIFSQNQSFETIAGLTDEQEMKRDEMIHFVNLKEQKVKEKNVNISDLSDFALELKGLDEIEQLIIGDFSESVNKEKLVKSMLQYYESKARILELILLEIENKEKNEIFEQEIY